MARTTIKNSTLFYHDWLRAFEKMSDEDVGKITKALLLLDSEGVRTTFEDNPILDIIFSQFSSTVERNREKYDESCQKRSDAAKKREAQKITTSTILHNCDDRIRKDSDSDSDSDTDKDSDKRRVVSGGEWSGKDTPAPAADTTTTTELQSQIVNEWNSHDFVQKVKRVDSPRKRWERTEMAIAVSGGPDAFLNVLRSLDDQAYLRKQPDNGYMVMYDWLTQPEVFQNVLEGKYEKERSKFGDGWEVVEYDKAGG